MTDDIEDLRERYATAPAGGPRAAHLARTLGLRLAAAYFRDEAGRTERDEAIILIDEALAVPDDRATVLHVARGMLFFFRAMPIRPGPDNSGDQAMALASALMGGILNTPERIADRDRALAHLHWVVAHEPPGEPVRAGSEAMIAALALIGVSGLDEMMGAIGRLMAVAATLGEGPQLLVELLGRVNADEPPARLVPAFDAVLRQLPAGHRLRPVILAEAGAVLARHGAAELPPGLDGLPAAIADALDTLRDDDPGRDLTVRRLAGLLVSTTARSGDPAGVDRAVTLADQLVGESGSGRDHFLRALARTLRGRLRDDPDDLRAAVDDLRTALATLPPADPLRPVATGMLGVLFNDRYLLQGVRTFADAGAELLAGAGPGAADADRTVIELAGLMSEAVLAIRARDRSGLDTVIGRLEAGLSGLAEGYPWRSRLDAALGLARLTRGVLTGAADDLRAAAALFRKADGDLAVEASGRPAMRAAGALADLMDGLHGDPAALARAAAGLDAAAVDPLVPVPDRAGLELLGAQVALARGDVADAIVRFEAVRSGPLADRPGHPLAAQLHDQLAEAYRVAGRAADAVTAGLAALRAHGDDVLLQTGTAYAVQAADRAAGLSRRVAEWAFAAGRPDQGLEAIELARGIVLHSAMVGAGVPELLRAAGRPELADEWERTAAEPAPGGPGTVDAVRRSIGELLAVPSDLRPRVLTALHAAGAEPLSAAPDRAAIAAAVRDAEADAIVYLLAGEDDRPGRLLVVTAAGELTVHPAPELCTDAPAVLGFRAGHAALLEGTAEGWRDALGALCDWAWPALMKPLLAAVDRPAAVVLVPVGDLGDLPWHAARRDGGYALADTAFSYAASARQLRAVLRRPRSKGPVTLVAVDPGDLPSARPEVDRLKAAIYPDAVVGPDTPEAVRREFAAGPAVLHLACHAVTGATPDRSHLVLAGSAAPANVAPANAVLGRAELPVADILAGAPVRAADAPGGLVVLSACGTDLTASSLDEALTLATAFLAAGAVSVVGSRWPVPDRATACLMVMFHHFRTAGGLADRPALRAAQCWMLDPGREVPEAVKPIYPRGAARLADPVWWASFAHHGR